jgi:hypothetical protein
MNLPVSGTGCKISFVSDDGEAWIDHHLVVNDHSGISIVITEVKPQAKYLKLINGSISLEEVPIYNYLGVSQPYLAPVLIASTSRGGDNLMMSDQLHGGRETLKEVELPRKEISDLRDNISTEKSCANFVLRLPVQLSREVVREITCGFKKRNFADRNKKFILYDGFLSGYQARVLIKTFTGDCGGILEAEKNQPCLCTIKIYSGS